MKGILGAIVAGIIVAMFTWWLGNNPAELKYTLSEQIPLQFGVSAQESVQQLEVKNLGKNVAEGIQVKTARAVSDFKVLKDSEADKVETFSRPDGFEVLYPRLPPQGSFRVVFKTAGAGIGKSDIVVKYSGGLALEALSSEPSVRRWIFLAVALLYAWGTAMLFRSMAFDSWERHAKYDSERVLKASKPFYANDHRWKEIRKRAMEEFGHSFAFDYGPVTQAKILAWPVYVWLNQERPTCLSEDEWLTFRAAKTKQLLATLQRRVAESMRSTDIRGALRVSRPAQVAPEEWQPLQKKITTAYIQLRADEISMEASQGRPMARDEADTEFWPEIEIEVSKKRLDDLSRGLQFVSDPMRYLSRQDLSMLMPEHRDGLKDRAYKLQLVASFKMMNESDARKFLREQKPDWMKEDDYARATEQAREVLGREDYHRRNADQLVNNTKAATELATLKERICRQLEIIERLLADPTSVERVEPYDNPFTDGNFRVLLRLAKALSSEAPSKVMMQPARATTTDPTNPILCIGGSPNGDR